MQFLRFIISSVVLITAVVGLQYTVKAQDVRVIGLELDRTEIFLPCQPGMPTRTESCLLGASVTVKAVVSGVPAKDIRLQPIVTGGQIVRSQGTELEWDLTGVAPGTYTITVAAVGSNGELGAGKTDSITIAQCPTCRWEDSCPTIKVEAPESRVTPGSIATFRAMAHGLSADVSYNWTVSAGTIVSGQGTPEIVVEVGSSLAGSSITATLEIGGSSLPGFCNTSGTFTDSETVVVVDAPRPVLIDQFATDRTTCEDGNARLDQFFVELNNNPMDRGVIVVYGLPERPRVAWHREQLLRNFIKFRRFDVSRITFIGGLFQTDAKTQFWRVPPGADDEEVLRGETTVPAPPERAAPVPTKPYLYATASLEPLPECNVPMFDLAEYAKVLNSQPQSRGRIVIGEPTRAGFARQQREIASELAANGVARSRIVFVYKYVRPNRALETIELWVVPPRAVDTR